MNPVVDPVLDATGRLTFANAAVDADVAPAPTAYRTVWARFDNESGAIERLGERTSPTTSVSAPGPLRGDFVKIDISARGTRFSQWTVPLQVYFRSDGVQWRLVGIDREAPADGDPAPHVATDGTVRSGPPVARGGQRAVPR